MVKFQSERAALQTCQSAFTCLKLTWKHQNNVQNLSKVNNKDTKTTSMTLTSNRFHILLGCFRCWLWTSKCQFDKACFNKFWIDILIKLVCTKIFSFDVSIEHLSLTQYLKTVGGMWDSEYTGIHGIILSN